MMMKKKKEQNASHTCNSVYRKTKKINERRAKGKKRTYLIKMGMLTGDKKNEHF